MNSRHHFVLGKVLPKVYAVYFAALYSYQNRSVSLINVRIFNRK